MPEYRIENIVNADTGSLETGIFLVMLNAKTIPPHLGIAVNGQYYSLTAHGQTVDEDIGSILELVRSRSIAALFFRLKLPGHIPHEASRSRIKELVKEYPQVIAGTVTCLYPVKKFCEYMYGLDISAVNYVFELLPELDQIGAVEECLHLNMEKHVKNGVYQMRKYNMEDINRRIQRYDPKFAANA